MKEKIKAKGKAARSQSEKPVARSVISKKAKLPTEGKLAPTPSLSDFHEMEKGFPREDAQGFLDKLTELSEPDHFTQIREAVLFSNILANDHRVPINDVLFLAGLLLAPKRGAQQEESWRIVISWLEEQGQSSSTELLGLDVYGIGENEMALKEIGSMSSLPYPEIPVRKEVFDVLEKSQKLAEKVALSSIPLPTRHLSVRHLLAQILWGRSLRVKSHLRRLKYDLGGLKQLFFFKTTEIWKDTDLKDAWADFLEIDQIESLPQAVNVIPEPISQAESRESGPTSDMEEKAIESEGLPEPLFVGCEADSPSDEDDPLSVRQDVHAICAVLAARDVHLPLSLGLFGDWGMGKTYFMERMYERIDLLTKASQFKSLHETVYCKNILQIRFNAWHFIDANPWAVMVTQILDEMYDYLSKDSGDSWQNAVKTLEQDKGLFAEAKYTLQQANNSVIAAERSLQSVQKAREQREMEVQRQFNSLKILLGVKAQIELRKAARRFGWGEELQSVEELSQGVHELKSRTGRLRNFFKVLAHSEYAIPSLGLLVLILLLPLGIGILVPYITQRTDFVTQVGVFIAQMGTIVVGGMAWLKKSLRWLSSGIAELEDILMKVEETRQQRLSVEKVTPDCELAVLREKESAARESLRQSEKRFKEAELEFKEAQPSRRLYRLIEERTESKDYQSRLGVISLIRKDFESLSRLVSFGELKQNGEETPADGRAPQSIPLDRIILYIDDLDGCSAHRVVQVLEVIHLLLAFPNFVVVVGADLRQLRRSLELHYPPLLSRFSDDRTKVFVSSRAHAATPQNYLENIFQIPFTLNFMGKREFQRLVRDLVKTPTAAEEKSDRGISNDLEDSFRKKDDLDDHSRMGMGVSSQEQSNISGLTDNDRLQKETKGEPDLILNPPTLGLTSKEKNFLESMNHLLRTPRTLKKFVNTYRIFRARLTISSLDRLIGTESQPGEFQCAMVLLGIITGFPTLASKAMKVLFQQDVQATWEDYVTNLKAQPPREEDGLGEDMPASIQELQAEWNRMCEALANIYGGEPLPFRTSKFIKWAPQLARYSFSIVPPHWQESMSTMKG